MVVILTFIVMASEIEVAESVTNEDSNKYKVVSTVGG